MKKIILLFTNLLFITSLFSQVRLNVWDKSTRTGKTVTRLKTSELPVSFESALPDGTTEIYDKWNVPTIKLETSSGKTYNYKPNAYKSRGDLGVLTYTEDGWEGLQISKTGTFYSMTVDKIIVDTTSSSQTYIDDFCQSIMPQPTGKTEQTKDPLPQVSKLVNADYYNKNIPINKNLTVYVEVANDLHRFIGTNTSPNLGTISVTKTRNWVTNLFLGVSQIYANEGLNVVLNKIYVWETLDTYGYTNCCNAYTTLLNFSSNISNDRPTQPESHFRHLLTKLPSVGGIAWIGGNSDGFNVSTLFQGSYFRSGYSNIIDNDLPTSPTNISNYSRSLFVVSHELGHNFGSKHTHWCGWKNEFGQSVGRIDSCYPGEQNTTYITPNCTGTTNTLIRSSSVPTIMSYCELRGPIPNVLTNGFGKLSRFAIRNSIDLSPDIPYSNISPPTVTTASISLITSSTARSGGSVTSDGGGSLTARGVCWAVSPTTPTISNSTTNDGIATGDFTSNITGLVAGTTYIVRAYATNSAGTSYGSTVTFTTSAATIPVLTTNPITNITQTTSTSGGTITNSGGSNITSKGVCWSTSPSPTISLSTKTNDGTGSGNFTSSITGLVAGTTYYVRSYAQNGIGVGYGNEVTFTSGSVVTPTISTTSITTFTNTTATMGGNVTSSGGATVSRRGVCYATTQNPTISNTVVDIGTGTGTFSQSVTGLSQGVTYYVRAFAENSAGINYGSQVSFKTLTTPTISTSTTTNITINSATSGGNVTSTGGGSLTVSARGVCYSTTTNPTTANSTVSGGTGTGTFTCQITGLSQGVLYYVRAFATNSLGTSYGSQVSFRTLNVPTVTTTSASAVSQTSATTGGNVTSAGGGTLSVTDRGIVYSTNQNPTITDTKIAAATPTGTGTYTINLFELLPGTVYYARAYATNSIGTGYGSQITITTTNIPILSTTSITSISTTTATSGGTISSSVGSSVTARGVCYSTSPNPTTSNTTTSNGTGTGAFTSSITGLTPSTLYYVRAYAINTTGTGYGNELSFTTTSSGSVPSVTTTAASGISQTTAFSGGNVTSDGGFSVTARGICYATTQNPTLSNTVVNSGTGTGVFISSLSGLSPNTTYYIRAFATNSNGTNFGTQVSFTTLPSISIPTLTTNTVTSITSTSATSGGNVTSDGGLTVTSRGICYATTQNPTTSNTTISSGSGTGSFSVSITGLTSGVTYYVRAYAINSAGTNYGSQQSFTTLSLATLSTTSATSVTSTTATTGGNITSDGGSTVTSRGVCYSTTQNPTLSNSFTTNGSGTGSFTASLTGLSENTTYYVRSYATNSVGTNYGSQISFTTSTGSTIPTVTTTAVTSVTSNSAVSGGNVTSAGSQLVTSRGIVWSTSTNPTISLTTKTSDGSGTGTFTSTISSLSPTTTYYVRAYATNSVGTAYGNQVEFTTSSSGGGGCNVTNLTAYKSNGVWRFRWNINSTCNSYTVTASRYSNTNQSIPPGQNGTSTRPTATGVRLTNYIPTSQQLSQGFIDLQMNPQPLFTGHWYSFDVKCNASVCTPSPSLPTPGLGNTRSPYFYTSP